MTKGKLDGMKEVYDFLKACKTYYLATAEGDQPRVRPFGTIDIFDNKLHIQTGKRKSVSKQIKADPKIEICAFDGKSWLRVSAEAFEDPRIEAQEHMLSAYPELSHMYKPGDGNNQVFALNKVEAVFSSFSGESKKISL